MRSHLNFRFWKANSTTCNRTGLVCLSNQTGTFVKRTVFHFSPMIICVSTRTASLTALSPLEDGEEDNDDEDLVDGADCDCPIGISSIYQSQDLNTRSFLGTITCRHKAIIKLFGGDMSCIYDVMQT